MSPPRGALAPEQIERFRRDGFLVLDEVVTEEELEPIEAVLDRFVRGEIADMGRDFCDMSGSYDRPFAEWALVNAVLPRRYAPELRGNAFERRAALVARQLLGEDATLDYDQLLAKRPRREDAVFAWHQDLGYWPTGTPDTKTATFSLALDDAREANGCLRVVPGSNREASLRPHRPARGGRDASHTLVAHVGEAEPVVHLPVGRGCATVHDERIVHGSGGNRSASWRRTYVVAFRSRATVEYERRIGFTHSHDDRIHWKTHLEALQEQALPE